MTILEIRSALMAARAVTGDKHIAARAANGLLDVVRAVPPTSGRGTYTITVLRSGLSAEQAVAYLEGMLQDPNRP